MNALERPPTVIIIVISGSRSIVDQMKVEEWLNDRAAYYVSINYEPHFRVGDCKKGVDPIALYWARQMGYPVTVYTASDANAIELMLEGVDVVQCSDWAEDRDGRGAGPMRNAIMLTAKSEETNSADRVKTLTPALLLAAWDGESRGTKHAMDVAKTAGIFIHRMPL